VKKQSEGKDGRCSAKVGEKNALQRGGHVSGSFERHSKERMTFRMGKGDVFQEIRPKGFRQKPGGKSLAVLRFRGTTLSSVRMVRISRGDRDGGGEKRGWKHEAN